MSSAEQLIELFTAAKAHATAAERRDFLLKACAGQPELVEQVLSLLDADRSPENFLQLRPASFPVALLTERPGDTIGRYTLLELIGEGGCGVVYMAEQDQPVRRRVALKIIKPGMDTRQVIARFEAERQALALMDHPNIAQVFDGGATETGRPYFVMELVRGSSITTFCDDARLPTKDRLKLFIRVCQAVQHAHQKGIIHRDLKPSNILVTVNGGDPVPKVIDFGISKATGHGLTDQTLLTQFNAFLGTPAYTSPEQAEMSSVGVDTRSDIYSMGVLLYELLTGRTPFTTEELMRGGIDEMRRTIRNKEPRQPSTCLRGLEAAEATSLGQRRQVPVAQLAEALRGDLDSIVMKCLEKEPARRYGTMNGLSLDIERHLNSEPVAARPPSAWYVIAKLARRHKGALVAAASVLGFLLAAIFVLSLSNLRIRQERRQKDIALAERSAALEAARESEHRAREQLFTSLQSQAQARRNSQQAGQRLESLAALAEAAHIRSTAELRDSAIAAMAKPDVEQGPAWPVEYSNARAITHDSRFRHYARLGPDGIISIRTIPGDQELKRLEAGLSPGGCELSFSPNGQLLAYVAGSGQVQVWEWESGRTLQQPLPKHCSGALAFSRDDQRLAIGHDDFISCFDLSGMQSTRTWKVLDRAYSIEFDPNSRRLAVGYVRSNLVSIYNAADGSTLSTLPTGRSSMTVVAWHPDGNLLAFGGSDRRIQIWGVEERRSLALLEGHSQQVNHLMFHWSGEMLASMSWDNVLRLWQPVPGRVLMKVPAVWMSFSREGHWAGVMAQDGHTARLWGIVPTREYQTFVNTFPHSEDSLREGDLSADGTLLALGTTDGLRLWDVTRGREVARIPMGNTTCALFVNHDHELLTCGAADGLQRWPLTSRENVAATLQLGPPKRLAVPFAPMRMAKSRENTLAVVGESAGQCILLDLTSNSVRSPSMPHAKVGYVALTGDGKRMVTSGWHSEKARVWDAVTGNLIRELDGCLTSQVFFTPAGELIIAHDKEFTFHSLDSLEVTRRIPRRNGLYAGHVAFTTDGKLMALEVAPGIIHVKEVASGYTVAQLEDPHGDVSSWIAFTSDGTKLVVVAKYAGVIHRWDLRAIRVRLKAMHLDWDWPDFPAVPAVDPHARSQ